MRRCNLRAVLPVYFISVVLRWIVARSDVDSCNTSQFADCVRQFRCRAKRFEDISLDSVCRKTKSCFICKFWRHPSGIKCNCDSLVSISTLLYVICKSLCCFSYSINIHTVGSGSDHTTKSGCSKFQIRIKAFFYFIFIVFQTFQLCLCVCIKIWI